jgi:RNA polymerase sigma-70 factor (ECF subfamily)
VAVDEDTAAALDELRSLDAWRDQADAFELNASLGRLHDCLQALEPARRLCVLHAYVDGLSHGEIARKLGAPLGTVKAWVRRSLQALKGCMA